MTNIDFGRKIVTFRPSSRLSARWPVRPLVIAVITATAALGISVLAIGSGQVHISPGEVLGVFFGETTRSTRNVVLEWRSPRVLLALVIGAALGIAGGIFQALTRNPLGSPDVIGFSVGSYTGALVAIMFVGREYYQTAAGALIGGFATALVVYLLAYRQGVQGFRLIVIGIAVSAGLSSVNQWLIVKADVRTALAAAVWSQGSLNGITWEQAVPVTLVVVAAVMALLTLGQRLAILQLGDDSASALGVTPEPTRLGYLAIGVVLTAAATAVTGPITFVALAAPQLARRMSRSAGISLIGSAVVGALLLALSDYAAQRLFATHQMPVGVITVSIGGLYFMWLLVGAARQRS